MLRTPSPKQVDFVASQVGRENRSSHICDWCCDTVVRNNSVIYSPKEQVQSNISNNQHQAVSIILFSRLLLVSSLPPPFSVPLF